MSEQDQQVKQGDRSEIRLTPEESVRFAQLCAAPPEPNQALKDAMARYRGEIHDVVERLEAAPEKPTY